MGHTKRRRDHSPIPSAEQAVHTVGVDFSSIDAHDTYYRRLKLDESADAEIIRVVYRRLARRYHPDHDPGPLAQRRMSALNEAYEVLIDPDMRDAYDAALAALRNGRGHDRPKADSAFAQFGAAGAPLGPPSGTVLSFGRYRGWTLGQIKRHDPEFLEWLAKMPVGRIYQSEISSLLRRSA